MVAQQLQVLHITDSTYYLNERLLNYIIQNRMNYSSGRCIVPIVFYAVPFLSVVFCEEASIEALQHNPTGTSAVFECHESHPHLHSFQTERAAFLHSILFLHSLLLACRLCSRALLLGPHPPKGHGHVRGWPERRREVEMVLRPKPAHGERQPAPWCHLQHVGRHAPVELQARLAPHAPCHMRQPTRVVRVLPCPLKLAQRQRRRRMERWTSHII